MIYPAMYARPSQYLQQMFPFSYTKFRGLFLPCLTAYVRVMCGPLALTKRSLAYRLLPHVTSRCSLRSRSSNSSWCHRYNVSISDVHYVALVHSACLHLLQIEPTVCFNAQVISHWARYRGQCGLLTCSNSNRMPSVQVALYTRFYIALQALY